MSEKTAAGKRIAFYTLGCKVNQNETEALSALFRERGYEVVDFADQADYYVINSCTVTHLADRKSRQMIRRAVKTNPRAKVVVTGCYAQTDADAIQKIPGVSLVVGTNEKSRLVDLLEELSDEPRVVVRKYADLKDFEEITAEKDVQRARAYLKVQEGCNQFCSYCIIPYARGPVRSRPVESALQEAEKLIRQGFKEIVLTGIHLGAYGQDLGKKYNLEKLVLDLLRLDFNVRWRLSSLEPTEVTPGIIRMLKEYRNFCTHLHLPLQSGHDAILRAMNRPYTTAQYLEIVTEIKKAVPDIAISTDVMVGFPGEKEEYFQEYWRFVEKVGFSRLHVFKYSPRQGTPAADFPDQIPAPVKEARSRRMLRLGEKLEERYAEKFLLRVVEVLVEEQSDATLWEGSSANYLKVRFTAPSSPELLRGKIVPVFLREFAGGYCIGELFQIQ